MHCICNTQFRCNRSIVPCIRKSILNRICICSILFFSGSIGSRIKCNIVKHTLLRREDKFDQPHIYIGVKKEGRM